MVPVKQEYWNGVAREWSRRGYHNELLAEHKRHTYLRLLAKWANLSRGTKILKTDLFAEALNMEQFLFEIARDTPDITGIDISTEIVNAAKRRAERYQIDARRYLASDVRRLPFRDGSFDLVISDSTLDHFPTEQDIITSLGELGRVLKSGGALVLTIDNLDNLTYPPYAFFRLWMKLGLTPYEIGRTLSLRKLRQVLEGFGLTVTDTTAVFHYPHPDTLVRWLENILRRVSRGRLDGVIRKVLYSLDGLEGLRTRYLTGRYLALKAVKD